MTIRLLFLLFLVSACATDREPNWGVLDRKNQTMESYEGRADACTRSGGRMVLPNKQGTRIRKALTWEEVYSAYCKH